MAVGTDILPTRYREPELIGRGGMGEIFRATDETLGRHVAVKILADRYAQDESVRNRFTREALTAARLSGEPNVVTIFDVGEHKGRPFIVMEYLPGGSLQEVIGRGAVELGRALEWLGQAARALDAAHASGVVHRDVKPANLLLDREGEVHVADFGIASAAGLDSLTRTGTVLGTAAYLSPEQARGERATPASDRYGLAVLAFELLTGSRPFTGDTAAAEAAAHVHAAVPAASARRPDLPPQVDDLFRRGLAKDPSARFSSAAEFVAELRDALHQAAGTTREHEVFAAPATPATVPYERARGRAWWPPAALALAAAAIGGIAAAALLTGDGDESPGVTTVVRTGPGTTETITTRAEETEPPPQAAPPPSGASGAELNDRGFELMEDGRYDEALPLLQQAVQKLSGSGERVEAFALYNLAFTKLQLGECDGVVDMLNRSEAIQGHRTEIDDARAQAQDQCG